MTCYIVFYYHGEVVCGLWKDGADRADCLMNAEWALICSDIDYDNFLITREVYNEIY